MKLSTTIATGAALVAGVSAGQNNYLGFNSGNTLPDESAKFEKDFLAEFSTAQKLVGAPGTFNAVRLYTNIQAYWPSPPPSRPRRTGTDNIDNELAALSAAVKQYGKDLTDLIIGVSIGSEDLYRDSQTGRTNKAGVGNGPKEVLGFINDYKKTFANTALANVPIGHVDTWDAWVNGTNKPVLDAVDWIGVDEYPFYETGKGNDISNAGKLFDTAFETTLGAANGKPVWVTETGWPLTGPDWDEAKPSVKNAQKYWQDIGCKRLFNKYPTFWYNLRDSNPANQVKFGISQSLSSTPSFDLTCPKEETTTSAAKPTATTLVKASGTPEAVKSGSEGTANAGGSKSSNSDASTTSSGPAAATTTGAGAVTKVSGAAL
ncbi:glycoside hydrolase, partial [Trichoderma reesei RUT C-30]